ncbi:putative Tubby protein like protein [Blattamonas nauphoetae]|uniref:Tubby protein like protein n=1 Tax=Blattamonas nauphoetae TaxID=2049346 RepID=A0ABQ9XIY0_9EUKA|nr:putative Tubby protein like protein [Blattamonas nauphoetae]
MSGVSPAENALLALQSRMKYVSETEGFSVSTSSYRSELTDKIAFGPDCPVYPIPDAVASLVADDNPNTTMDKHCAQIPFTFVSKAKAEQAGKYRRYRYIVKHSEEDLAKANSTDVVKAEVAKIESTPSSLKNPEAALTGQTQSMTFAPRTLNLDDIPTFVKNTIPPGTMLRCTITRKKGMFPTYEITTDDTKKFLLAAKRRPNDGYLISLNATDISKTSKHYQGKLKTLSTNSFILYSTGKKPSELTEEMRQAGQKFRMREEYVHIEFPREKAYRSMYVHLGKVDEASLKRAEIRPSTKRQDIEHLIKTQDPNLVKLSTRIPRKDPNTGVLRIEFHGRAAVASVKNHQLVLGEQTSQPDSIIPTIFLFGKMGDNKFSCDFTFPLCPLQAFGIALSLFEYE